MLMDKMEIGYVRSIYNRKRTHHIFFLLLQINAGVTKMVFMDELSLSFTRCAVDHFWQYTIAGDFNIKDGWWKIIWCAITQNIWNERNNRVFNGKQVDRVRSLIVQLSMLGNG